MAIAVKFRTIMHTVCVTPAIPGYDTTGDDGVKFRITWLSDGMPISHYIAESLVDAIEHVWLESLGHELELIEARGVELAAVATMLESFENPNPDDFEIWEKPDRQ